MKKIIIYSLFFSIILFSFSCRRGHGPGSYDYWGHGFGMGYASGCYDDRDYMMRDLGINSVEADKISAIDAKYRELYYKNRGDYDKINELRQEHRKAIDEALGDAPRSRFNKIYDSRWGRWGRGYGRRHMGDYYGNGYGMGYCSGIYSSSEFMTEDLGLNDDQAKKIADIDSKYRDLYYRNREDYNKIDALRLEHRKAIEEVLTPEQKKKFAEAYESRWRGWGSGSRMMGPGMMGY